MKLELKNKSCELLYEWIIKLIHSLATLEFPKLTLPETKQILEALENETNLKLDLKAKVVIGLKRGAETILDAIDQDLEWNWKDYIFLNSIINDGTYHSGTWRTDDVYLAGINSYKPPFPNHNTFWNLYQNFEESNKTIDDILNLFFDTIYNQFFNNGNKRTALLMVNYQLVKQDLGILFFDDEKTFTKLLVKFYSNRSKNELTFRKYLKQQIKTPVFKNNIDIKKR